MKDKLVEEQIFLKNIIDSTLSIPLDKWINKPSENNKEIQIGDVTYNSSYLLYEYDLLAETGTRMIFRKYGSFSITPIKDLDENGVVTWIVDMSNTFELLPTSHYMHRIVNAIRPYLRDEIIDQII